jgi:formylglycine-generating enzyme required for sulfatase activity
VVQVTWAGADRYCKSMGKSLPSEAQWERAAAGSDGRAFPWGEDSEPSCEGVAYGRRKGLRCETSGDAPRDVGTSSVDATAEGVYDLGGNVAEWTADDFADRYDGGCAPPCRDPVVRNDSGLKVARGGYFDGRAEALRSAGRSRFQVVSAQINVGFRCVKSAPSEEKP